MINIMYVVMIDDCLASIHNMTMNVWALANLVTSIIIFIWSLIMRINSI